MAKVFDLYFFTFPEAEVLFPLPLLCVEHFYHADLLTSFQEWTSHDVNSSTYKDFHNNN